MRVCLTRPIAHIHFLSYMCLVVLLYHYFFPFSGGFVHRRSANKRSSVSKFKGRVGKTDKLNVQRNRRGGIRL